MNLVLKVFLVLLFVAAMIFSIFSVLAYQYDKFKYEELTKQQLIASASIQKHRVAGHIKQIRNTLKMIASRTQLRITLDKHNQQPGDAHVEKMTRIINDAAGTMEEVRAISIITMEGKVAASTEAHVVGEHIEDMPGSLEQIQRVVIAKSVTKSDDGEILLTSRGPLYLDDRLIGMVEITTSNQTISDITSDYTGFGQTGETVVAKSDNDGAIFLTALRFDPDAALKKSLKGTQTNVPMIRALNGEEYFFDDVVDYRGEAVLAATAYIETVDWGLVVKIDRKEVDNHLNSFRTELLTMLLFVLPLVVILSFVLSRNLARPIISLTDVVNAFARGDFSQRADESMGSELGQLAKAFNTMTEELTATQRRLTEAQSISHMGSWELDVVNDRLYWSDEVYRIFDIDAKSFNPTYDAFLEFVHEDDLDAVKKSFKEALRKRTKYHITHKIRTRNGEVKVLEETAVHQFDKEGNPIKSIGAVLDITLAKTQEKQLQELLRLADDHIIMSTTDVKGNITYASKAFCEISGFDLSELIGQNHRIVRHPEMPKSLYDDLWGRLKSDRTWQGELKNRKKDGGFYWVYASIGPIYDLEGKKIGYTAIREDITDRKVVEETQRISQMGSFEVDIDSALLTCSDQTLRILGIEHGNAVLSKEFFLGLIKGPYRDTVKRLLFDASTQQKNFDVDVEVRTMTQGDKSLRIIGEVELDTAFNPVKVFGSLQDVTLQKMVSDELVIAKEEAEKAVEIKGHFVANMSHEIRTPMNSIIGFLDIALRSDSLEESVKTYLEKSRNSASMLLGIINDILDFSKIDSDKMELEAIPFNLRTLTVEAYEMMEFNANVKELDLRLRFEDGFDYCYIGDPLRVKQILVNIIGNAVKFTDKGHIEVMVAHDDTSGSVCIEISDTGIGMTDEQLGRIFKPFTQADNTTVRKFGGTGLGTVICKNLVELMEGTIDVESAPGVGTTFIITLPLEPTSCEEALISMNAAAPSPSEGFRRFNILLAEDNPLNAELIQLNLGGLGHTITWAQNGVETVDRLKQQSDRFDLILMDVHMPEMDGIEATRQIRKLEKLTKAHIPIIALTASVTTDEQALTVECGMDGFAVKPLELHNLTKEMERVVPAERGIKGDGPLVQGETVISKRLQALSDVLDVKGGLDAWKSESKYVEALHYFVKNHRGDIEAMRQALDTGDKAEALRICHTLKGLTHGAKRLTESSEAVYRKIAADEPGIDLSELKAALDEVIDVIGSIDVETRTSKAKLSADVLAAQTDMLIEQLDNGDCDDRLYADVIANLKPFVEADVYDRIADSIDNFDYEHAVGLFTEARRNITPKEKS
jgi:PAS domain S-box-containing protein